MTFRKQLVCLMVLASLYCGGSLFAQIEIPQGKWWKNDPELVQALNLTPQQVDQIESIFERYREPLLDLQLDFRKKSLDLERLLQADSLDERRIEAQASVVEQARSEMAKQRLMMMVKVRNQLRPEQWRILREKHAQRQRERRLQPMEPPRGPMQGGGRLRRPLPPPDDRH